MSDHDTRGNAWRVTPTAYLEARPASHPVPPPRSFYLTMRDGCRLAVDVYVPDESSGERRPTILIATPYYRRFKLRQESGEIEPGPNIARYRDVFVPRGYAMVIVDVRGTGASFGTRDSFRSPRERDDYLEIVEWIVAQPWSDGGIGCTGVSYVGAAADFIASTGHPAVKAIAPLFSVWDTYSDHYYPGGVYLNDLALQYGEMMQALDQDDRELIKKFGYFANPAYDGPCPVDEDVDGSDCRAAVAEHAGNFRMVDFMREFQFKEEGLPYDPSFSSASFSPYSYCAGTSPDVAVYSVSGWTDGTGYANGAISRFLTLPGRYKYLLLGPWDHGAKVNTSPWRTREEPEFHYMAEMLRFFDQHLAGIDTGLLNEEPIHLFSFHEEAWKAASSWPPITEHRDFFLGANGTLASTCPDAATQSFKVDFGVGTGRETRYERISGLDCRNYYTDWAGRDRGMLRFTSDPLESPTQLSGHGVVELHFTSSEPDAGLFVYVAEIQADGTERYVTEGMLRALHRAEAPCPPTHRTTWPYRTFRREDSRPLVPGSNDEARFALLPTSWTFARGSRIRIAIAGGDADHCIQIPHGRPPRIDVFYGGPKPSLVRLPLRRIVE